MIVLTFNGNVAEVPGAKTNGGGFFLAGAKVSLEETVVANNSATSRGRRV